VFSLAATLYAALTGAIPEDALERAMGRAALTSVRDRSVKVSQGLALAIEKALSVKPDDRYQSVNEFAVALKAALSSTQETIVSRLPYLAESEVELDVSAPGPLRSRVESEAPRRRRWFGAGLTVVILTTVLLGVLFLRPELARELIGNFAPSSPESPAPTSTDLTSQVAVITETQSDLTPTATLVPVIAEKSPLPSATPTEEPTPAATPLGGGVGQIAFASARSGIPQIYLLNVDSTGLTQLTNMEDGACQPIWSPDGMELVFTSPCPRNREQYVGASLWLLELESMEVTQLPHVIGGGDYDPAWSPDGRRIAFTSVRDRIQQIYVLEVDGETLVRVSSGKARDYQPVWDPRGTQILFSTLRSETTTIWFMPDKGGEATQFSAPTGRDDSHADWSPDGQFILFEREIGGIPRLVVKSFEDRDHIATQLCVEGPHASQPMAEPRWSPDGRWIVFESWPEGDNHNIAIISSSCTNYAELTTDPSVDFDPDWRP
jgi:Tol biopolymer transport system component